MSVGRAGRGRPALCGIALCGAWLLLLSALPAPSGAEADPDIERRIEALRALERIPPATPPRPRSQTFACPESAAWQRSRLEARARTAGAVRDASLRFGVPADLLRSMIHHESAGRADAVSPKGAMGIMQLMPGTARSLGVVCPFDPRESVMAGARYLKRLRDALGSWEDAVAGYHAGPARARSGRLPASTRAYLERVIGTWRAAR